MKRRSVNLNILFLATALSLSSLLFLSCEKEHDGPPVIEQVRQLDSTKRDSFFTAALGGVIVVIQGHGFDGLQNVYFNGMETPFNQALNTDRSIVVQIPADAPTEDQPGVPNNIRIVTNHGEATFSFRILVPPPAPLITWASNENAVSGETITFGGTDLTGLTQIVFPGGMSTSDFTINGDGTDITVTVPAGVVTGDTIRLNGQFGSGKSNFVYNNYLSPKTGFLANFEDGDPYFGWQWWGGIKANDASTFPDNTGNFIEVKPAGTPINAGDGAWYSDNRAVMVAAGPWVEDDNMGAPIDNYALKFEIFVKTPWTNGSLIIAPNGNFDLLARYAPWETAPNATFVTSDWQTVTIPLNSFLAGSGNYDPAGAPAQNFAALTGGTNSASIQIILYNDSDTPLTAFDAAFDNVRIVKVN